MKKVKIPNYRSTYVAAAISVYFNIFLCISSYAQSDSLTTYLEISAKNSPVVLQKYYEYEASLQKVPQVGSLPDPELSMGFFLKPMELLGGKQVADFRLMQMFPWFDVLKSAKDEMSLMAKAEYESFRDAKLQVFYDVQRTWYEMHKIKQNIRISEKNIEILQTIERLAIVRFKTVPTGNNPSQSGNYTAPASSQNTTSGNSGMQTMGGSSGSSGNAPGAGSVQSSPQMQGNAMGSSSGSSGLTDVYRIQIEIADLQNNIELMKSRWSTLSAQFNSYLNRPPDAVVTLPDTLLAGDFQLSILTMSDSSFTENPMLSMLKFKQQSLEARKQMVTKMGYPMVGLGVNYALINKSEMSTSSMNGEDMIMPMVTATIPVYRKKYKAMQAEADLLKSANQQNYTATTNGLQTEYYQAIQLYSDAQRRTKLYASQFQLASQSLEIMLRSFASAGSSLTDILRIRQQTLDYEYKQIEAVADYNTAIAWLQRLMASSINQ